MTASDTASAGLDLSPDVRVMDPDVCHRPKMCAMDRARHHTCLPVPFPNISLSLTDSPQ